MYTYDYSAASEMKAAGYDYHEYGTGIEWWRLFKKNKKVAKWDNSAAIYKLIPMAAAIEQGFDAGRYAEDYGSNWEKRYL